MANSCCVLPPLHFLYLHPSQTWLPHAWRSAKPPLRVRRPSEAFRCTFASATTKRTETSAQSFIYTSLSRTLGCQRIADAGGCHGHMPPLKQLEVTQTEQIVMIINLFPVEFQYYKTVDDSNLSDYFIHIYIAKHK